MAISPWGSFQTLLFVQLQLAEVVPPKTDNCLFSLKEQQAFSFDALFRKDHKGTAK